jgi:hypothetical protein
MTGDALAPALAVGHDGLNQEDVSVLLDAERSSEWVLHAKGDPA